MYPNCCNCKHHSLENIISNLLVYFKIPLTTSPELSGRLLLKFLLFLSWLSLELFVVDYSNHSTTNSKSVWFMTHILKRNKWLSFIFVIAPNSMDSFHSFTVTDGHSIACDTKESQSLYDNKMKHNIIFALFIYSHSIPLRSIILFRIIISSHTDCCYANF